jgi:hypothetical protein
MKKQKAVEWLIDQVEDFIGLIPKDIIEQAKEMEKQQEERLIDETLNAYGIINNLKTNKI